MQELEKRIKELEEQVKVLSSKEKEGTAIVVFSGDMDKVLAAMNIAVGNLSLGKEVSLFFTFWGTTALRKVGPQTSGKHIFQRMLGWMTPKGLQRLPLSRLNFWGLGPWMMRFLMKKYHFAQLQELMDMAKELDVKIYMCTMSMDLMGIKKEELISDVELVYTGVPGFMEVAGKSSLTLFI